METGTGKTYVYLRTVCTLPAVNRSKTTNPASKLLHPSSRTRKPDAIASLSGDSYRRKKKQKS